MGKNLYLDDLSQFCLADLEEFLGLALPADQRMPEGVRLDYKAEPKDIGAYVAMFANTYGGVLMIGVSDENGRPTATPGVAAPKGSDLATKFSNSILGNVYPVVPVEICTVQTAEAAKWVVIVRVPEGDFPPYMYTSEKQNRVPVRYGDRIAYASPFELEAMFQKRNRAGHGFGAVSLTEGDPDFKPLGHRDGLAKKADVYIRIVLRPRASLAINWHRATEKLVREVVEEFSHASIGIAEAETDKYEFFYSLGDQELRWRVYTDGTIEFAADELGPNDSIYLADVVHDMAGALVCARRMWERLGYQGRAVLTTNFYFKSKPIEISRSRYSEPWALDGIAGFVHKPHAENSIHTAIVDHAELADPSETMAIALNHHMRALRRTNTDLNELTRSIKAIVQQKEPQPGTTRP